MNPHPAGHPNARQAQRHINHSQLVRHVEEVDSNGEVKSAQSDELSMLHKLQVSLEAGEAVWIPAGWFHEVFSDYSNDVLPIVNYTASIATTANTEELGEFKAWIVRDGALKLPPG